MTPKADIAEALSNEGWLTVLDGPLHGIRHRRGLPVIGYVKTHHRRMLAREHSVRVPELTAAMEDALYGCDLRLAEPGEPWTGPWAGIAASKMPSRHRPRRRGRGGRPGRGWLPGFCVGAAPGLRQPSRLPCRRTPLREQPGVRPRTARRRCRLGHGPVVALQQRQDVKRIEDLRAPDERPGMLGDHTDALAISIQ